MKDFIYYTIDNVEFLTEYSDFIFGTGRDDGSTAVFHASFLVIDNCNYLLSKKFHKYYFEKIITAIEDKKRDENYYSKIDCA